MAFLSRLAAPCCRVLRAIALFGLVGGFACSCEQSRWAFWRKPQDYAQSSTQQQQAWNQAYPSASGGYAMDGYGNPRGQRVQPNSPPSQPYSQRYPSSQASQATASSSAGQGQAQSRWITGNTWENRVQTQPNWRGSGVGWRRGHRQTPGQFSRQTKRAAAPSTAASSWQTAPYYSDTSQGGAYSAYAPPASGMPPSGYGSPPAYGGATSSAAYDAYSPSGAGAYAYGAGTAGTSSYVIQKGDTLSGIARDHQVSLSALLQANGLTRDQVIFPGQPLTIPR